MSGFRAYYDFKLRLDVGDFAQLCEEESRHLCGALRARDGDMVDLFNLEGDFFHAEIIKADKKSTRVKLLSRIEVENVGTRVALAQCLPKGKTFDDILRQSVEVGASAIFPIMSRYSEVRLESRADIEKKTQKWRQKLIEAIKQSANFFPFEIREPTDFETFIINSKDYDLKIVASLEPDSKPILNLMRQAQSACILIGPEGDMSAQEYARAREAGFLPAKLGKNVMKSETAALCSLSVIKGYFLSTENQQTNE